MPGTAPCGRLSWACQAVGMRQSASLSIASCLVARHVANEYQRYVESDRVVRSPLRCRGTLQQKAEVSPVVLAVDKWRLRSFPSLFVGMLLIDNSRAR